MFSQKILLSKNEDLKAFEEQQRQWFLYQLLSNVGVSLSDFWQEDTPLTIQGKIKLLKEVEQRGIHILEGIDGSMIVLSNEEKIGEFFKCSYILKHDPSERNVKNKLYLEAEIKFWTILEQANET